MSPQEVAAKFTVESARDGCERNAAGISGKDALGCPQARDLAPKLSFDAEIFCDGLDHPVAARDVLQMVFKIARRNEFGPVRGEKRARFLFSGILKPGDRRGVAMRLTWQDDVEQQSGDPGIRKVGRDTRPHSPRAQHRHTLNWLHTGSLPRTGLSSEPVALWAQTAPIGHGPESDGLC